MQLNWCNIGVEIDVESDERSQNGCRHMSMAGWRG